MSPKGQVFTSDFTFSMLIFFLILAMSVTLWNTAQLNEYRFQEEKIMMSKSTHATDILLKTKGYPENWNQTNVKLIGFADDRKLLDMNKINSFMNLSNEEIKNIWNLEAYLFNITINTTSRYLTKGYVLNSSAEYVVPVNRVILLNNSGTLEKGTLSFLLWR